MYELQFVTNRISSIMHLRDERAVVKEREARNDECCFERWKMYNERNSTSTLTIFSFLLFLVLPLPPPSLSLSHHNNIIHVQINFDSMGRLSEQKNCMKKKKNRLWNRVMFSHVIIIIRHISSFFISISLLIHLMKFYREKKRWKERIKWRWWDHISNGLLKLFSDIFFRKITKKKLKSAWSISIFLLNEKWFTHHHHHHHNIGIILK